MTPFAASLEKPSMTRTATAPCGSACAERRVVELGAGDDLVQARLRDVDRADDAPGFVESCTYLLFADDRRLGAGDDGDGVQVPRGAVVVDELVLARGGVVEVDAEVRRRQRLLVEVVDRTVGPRREDPAVRQDARLAVAADRRRVAARRNVRRQHVVADVLLVQALVARRRAARVVGRLDAHRVVVVARVDLDERARVDRPVARRDDADHDVRGGLLDREERVAGLVLPQAVHVLAGDRDLLRPVRVDAADLHVVRRSAKCSHCENPIRPS